MTRARLAGLPLALAALAALLCLRAPAQAAPTETALALSWADAIEHPIGPRGLRFSPAWLQQQGRRVSLHGHVVRQELPQPGRFLLAPQPLRLSEHADGDADDLPPTVVLVLLPPSQQDRIVRAPPHALTLSGRLSLGREERDGRVSWLRLQLDESALAAETGAPSDP